MKSAIILALVVMVSLAAQTSGAKVHQIYKVKRTNKLNLEQLIGKISAEIPDTNAFGSIHSQFYYTETREAPEVVKLLARTEPKNKIHPLLKFTIDDLLKLNEWTDDDCNDAEFAKRSDMCTQFFKEGKFSTGVRELESYEQKDFVHYNLGKYCWKEVSELKERCTSADMKQALKALKDSIGLTGKMMLSSFSDDVKRQFSKAAPYHLVIEEAVEKAFGENSNKSKLTEICKELVAKLKEFYKSGSLSKKWSKRFKRCSIVIEMQENN